MNIKTAPAVAQLGKFRSKLAASDAEGVKGQLNQLGINMVDLMMWLVIAALLLAAALQGIGYYQQAAWTYQAKSDVASVRTYVEAQFTLNNNVYPTFTGAAVPADLKLTSGNTAAVKAAAVGTSWIASVKSAPLTAAGKNAFFNFDSTTDNNVVAAAAATATLAP